MVVLADDLIWADRLVRAVAASGATPTHVRSLAAFQAQLARSQAAIVDLTARAYDAVEALRQARGAGVRSLAVGQHDDLPLRRSALAAGAERVYAYRKLFEDGPATLEAWLARSTAPS